MSVFTTIARYTGGLLKSGSIAIHERQKQIYFGLSGKETVEILHSAKDSGWIEPVLINGWETYDEAVAYRKDATGALYIKGTARYGALNYPIFQLPIQHRPTRNISLVILMREGHGRLDINENGYVIPRGTEEQEYDIDGNITGEIIEVAYLSLECGAIL